MRAKSNTKDYGLLTVIAQSFWAIDKVFEISSKDFYPPPAVASWVLSFKRIEENKTKGLDEKFLAFVKQAFSKRRKMMMKNLSEKYPADNLKHRIKA
jgi:16S rRNA (adenine1518-N6/adenine1519-N6)-dimethyltransferase